MVHRISVAVIAVIPLAVPADPGAAARAAPDEQVHVIELPAPGQAPKLTPSSNPESASTTPSTPTRTNDPAQQAQGESDQLRAARQQVTQLQAQVDRTSAELQNERARTASLEKQLAAERAQRDQTARTITDRGASLGVASDDLARANQSLVSGSPDVARDAIADAKARAAEAARTAAVQGSSQQAALATQAQTWASASEEALQRGDLFQARQALDAATRAAQAAQARGAEGAANGGRSGGEY